MIESAREVCGLVRVGRKNPKSVGWIDEVKTAVRRNEVLATSVEEAKYAWKLTEKKRERLKCV